MLYRLLSYPNKYPSAPNFYIQVKGYHSGRPLRKPIPNCVAVYSDIPNLFEIVFLLFKGHEFKGSIIGSVVPFIRLSDLKEVIDKGIEKQKPENTQLLEQTKAIEELISASESKINLLKSMQVAICREFLK